MITGALLECLDGRARIRGVDLDSAALAYASAAVIDDRAASIDALGQDGRIKLIEAMAARLDDYCGSDGALSVPSTCVLAAAIKPS